jgi:hypothetical protein
VAEKQSGHTLKRAVTTFRRFLPVLAVCLPNVAGAMCPDSLGASGRPIPWEFSVAGYYYVLPADDDVPIAVARADRGALHLEARYNYEDRKTVSVFAGWTLSAGESFTIALTPMAGVAFGRTKGIVPALEMSLGRGMFDFYAECEYLLDLNDTSGNFFYSWLELGVAPTELVRIGLAAQRTRVFESPLELDRGVFAQLAPEPGTVSLYAFNLFTESWFLVIGLELAW